MMRLVKYAIIGLLVYAGFVVKAQQIPHFTQSQWVGLGYNPAFAGSDDFFNAFAIHRSQWVGVEDAPRTYQLGVHAPSLSGKMGFGGHVFTDVTGPTRRFGVQGAYAYHLQMNEEAKLSLGLSFGLSQFSIDGTQITMREAGDNLFSGNMESELKPDASFGAIWYTKKYKLGISAMQILNNKLDFFPGDGDGRMAVHYYFTGSYLFEISDNFGVEPAVLLKYVTPLPMQLNIGGRLIYKDNLWLGATYRTADAIGIFAGYKIMDYLSLGYAYDIATSDIQTYTHGSHEILIQLRFGKKQLIETED